MTQLVKWGHMSSVMHVCYFFVNITLTQTAEHCSNVLKFLGGGGEVNNEFRNFGGHCNQSKRLGWNSVIYR